MDKKRIVSLKCQNKLSSYDENAYINVLINSGTLAHSVSKNMILACD